MTTDAEKFRQLMQELGLKGTTRAAKPKAADPDAGAVGIQAYNAALAKLMQRLKRDAGASAIVQNYKGTGSQAHRRQLWVHFTSGAVIDLWLESGYLGFGGVVMRSPSSDAPLPKRLAYEGTPEQMYARVAPMLKAWSGSTLGPYQLRVSEDDAAGIARKDPATMTHVFHRAQGIANDNQVDVSVQDNGGRQLALVHPTARGPRR